MKQFAQLLFLIILSSYFQLSASNFHRIDTIGKFNEVTDIEMRLKNLQDTDRALNENKTTLTQEAIVRSKDSIVSLPDTIDYPSDTLSSSLDTLHIAPYDSIIAPSDTIVLSPLDSIKIDTIPLPEEKKPVFTPIVV